MVGVPQGKCLNQLGLCDHLEGNLDLEIDLSIAHISFEPFPRDTLIGSVADVGALAQEDQGNFHFNYVEIYLESVTFTFLR